MLVGKREINIRAGLAVLGDVPLPGYVRQTFGGASKWAVHKES
jgi:hypothetical protein